MHNAISSLPSGMKTSRPACRLARFRRCRGPTVLLDVSLPPVIRHQASPAGEERPTESRLPPVGIRARLIYRCAFSAEFSTLLARETTGTVRRLSGMIPGPRQEQIETWEKYGNTGKEARRNARIKVTVRWIIQSSCGGRTISHIPRDIEELGLRKVEGERVKKYDSILRVSKTKKLESNIILNNVHI